MARNGVWELKDILLRYCASSGSSKGVRAFVERDLAAFAARNPQISFKTKIQGGHPCVYGTYGKLLQLVALMVFVLRQV